MDVRILLAPVRVVAAVVMLPVRAERALRGIEDMAAGVGDLRTEMRGMRADVQDLGTRVEYLRGDVTGLEDGIDRIGNATVSLDARVPEALDAVQHSVDALTATLAHVDAIASRFSRLGGRRARKPGTANGDDVVEPVSESPADRDAA